MPFRLEVADIFDISGRGIVVTGTIETGSVRVGDTLQLKSGVSSRKVVVASIEKFQLPALHEATAGPDDVGIGLFGVTRDQVQVRDVLVSDPGGRHG
jgi:translation elongation factor EF-Tu-like GTPase